MSSPKRLVVGGLGAALAASGLAVATPGPAHAAPVEIQILATNDFHGRLLVDPAYNGEAGAAVLSGAVKELSADNPNTAFVAAGDLIGASTFESFILQDKPTIDALNEAGLHVSAVGNHELDQGYDDLVDRVMAPYDADTNPHGGAEWEYIAANIEEPEGEENIAESWTQDFGGVTVGYVGAVTEDLPALVSPDGIAGVTVTDIVDSVNAEAATLRAEGADLVVMLVHEGSPVTNCEDPNFTNEGTTWGNITQNVSADVDAIVSGHTHLAYNCEFEVQEWVEEERAVTTRPVVSAGQYGANLNQLLYTVDSATGEISAKSQTVLPLEGNYPADPVVEQIVTDAFAAAEGPGSVVLGELSAPLNRANNGASRGGESTLGNLVAEVHRWAGESQIAFMNPGGLRGDQPAGTLTYKQAALMQPFANTLVNMTLTGEQIETVLEQQWQRDGDGAVPSRPMLRLGVSEGFKYTYTETPVNVGGTDTFQGEITGMWLDGTPIDPAATYTVTANSFLAAGGDNFREFRNGTAKTDTGKVDLTAMVDYMAEFAPEGSPLTPQYDQRAVEVSGVADSYQAGESLAFDVDSWSMSTADDVVDTEIQVKLGDAALGTVELDNTPDETAYDNTGSATIDVPLPASTPGGAADVTLVGEETGTEITVPVTIEAAEPPAKVAPRLKVTKPAKVKVGKRAKVTVAVTAPGVRATGTVRFKIAGSSKTVELKAGKASFRLPKLRKPGKRQLKVVYSGDDRVKRATKTVTIRVVRR